MEEHNEKTTREQKARCGPGFYAWPVLLVFAFIAGSPAFAAACPGRNAGPDDHSQVRHTPGHPAGDAEKHRLSGAGGATTTSPYASSSSRSSRAGCGIPSTAGPMPSRPPPSGVTAGRKTRSKFSLRRLYRRGCRRGSARAQLDLQLPGLHHRESPRMWPTNGALDQRPGRPATGNYLPHLFPVDQTLHWANPPKANCVNGSRQPDRLRDRDRQPPTPARCRS